MNLCQLARALCVLLCLLARGGAQIIDRIDWEAYLSRHDPIWRWPASECTAGYTIFETTIRHDESASCPAFQCSSQATCVEESAKQCDECASCVSFALSPLWNEGLRPQLYTHADAARMVPNKDWTTFVKGGPAMRNHSSCNVSPTAAVVWEDAAFYGNGLLGGLVLVDAEDEQHTLRLQIGRTDVADRRQLGSNLSAGMMFDKPRLPVGSLGLTAVGNITGGEMRVHLANATITGTLNTTLGSISFLLLAHYTELAVLLQWNASGHEAPDPATGLGGAVLTFVALPGNSTRHSPPPSYKPNPPPVCVGSQWGGGVLVCTQTLLAGGNYATAVATRAWGGASPPGTAQLLTVLHTANDWPKTSSPATATAIVSAVHAAAATGGGAGLADLLASNAAWWAGYWPQSFVSIADTVMEAMYVLQMYKYACAARPDGPAIDLMGPWWQQSGWELYWADMNVPTEYAAIAASRRFGILGGLSWWVLDRLPVLATNPSFPGRNVSGLLGFGSIFSFDFDAPYTVAPGVQLGNVPWLGHVLYEHAMYTANSTMLRQLVFPFLRGATNIYLHFAFTGHDGRLHLPATASPEYPYPHGPANDTHYDLALFKWGAQTLLALAEQLDIVDPLVPAWRDVVARLVAFPVNEHGYMVDSVNGFDVPHRHFSHLFAIYPLHLTVWDDADGGTPASRALIATSVDRWTGLTCTGGPDHNFCPNGFTFDGAASMSALMNSDARAKAAAGNVSGFIASGLMHAATLYSEGHQPCMESPGAAAAALQEMLLTSWGGRVRVFPGVPSSWQDVVVHRLGAEGGLAVSAVRANGVLAWVAVDAVDYVGEGPTAPPRTVVLVAAGLGPAASVGTVPAGVVVTDAPGGSLRFSVAVGSTVVLFPGPSAPALVVAALPGNSSQYHYWGKH